MSEPVALADDELIEAVAGVETVGGVFGGHRRGHQARRRTLNRYLNLSPEGRFGCIFKDLAEPLGDPGPRVRWRHKQETSSLERPDLERRDPDSVGGLA